ncbi:hypothetical protein Efla_003369 [Eimeria flavescens]
MRGGLRPLPLEVRTLQGDTMDSSPQYGGANRGTPLSMLDGTGVRNWVAMAEMYYDSIHAAANKRLLAMTPYPFTGKAFSRWGMLLTDAPEEVPKHWDDVKAMLLTRFNILANGESVQTAKAKEIFLSGQPCELACRAVKPKLKRCVQGSEQLRRELECEHELSLAWYENKTESNRRWAERATITRHLSWGPTEGEREGHNSGPGQNKQGPYRNSGNRGRAPIKRQGGKWLGQPGRVKGSHTTAVIDDLRTLSSSEISVSLEVQRSVSLVTVKAIWLRIARAAKKRPGTTRTDALDVGE